jgi:hypothetical protein
MMKKESSLLGFVAFAVAVYSILFALIQPSANVHRRAKPPVSEERQPAPDEEVDRPGRPSRAAPAKPRNLPERQFAYNVAVGEQMR